MFSSLIFENDFFFRKVLATTAAHASHLSRSLGAKRTKLSRSFGVKRTKLDNESTLRGKKSNLHKSQLLSER